MLKDLLLTILIIGALYLSCVAVFSVFIVVGTIAAHLVINNNAWIWIGGVITFGLFWLICWESERAKKKNKSGN